MEELQANRLKEEQLREEISDLEDRLDAARRKLHGDTRHRGPRHRRAPT